jgi:hypothetical protein
MRRYTLTGSARPLRLEQLEGRDAPAALVSPTRLAYRDADGDLVTVTFSKPILDAGYATRAFVFDIGGVDGGTAMRQQLRAIDLSLPAGTRAAGTSVTVVATRDPAAGGDGFAAVGQIAAAGIDLGQVSIDGDLGSIVVGDGDLATAGLRGLSVQSLGRYGTVTGAPDLKSVILGPLGVLRVRGDVREASVTVQAGGLGTGMIGGSILGGAALDGGAIVAYGDVGRLTVRGDLVGGTARGTGQIVLGGAVGSLTIGGSVLGGTASTTGYISAGAVRSLAIGGSLVGGTATGTAELLGSGLVVATRIGRLDLGGSLVAGTDRTTGEFFANGTIRVQDDLGTVRIRGSVVGNVTNPAIISARGQPSLTTATVDVAIDSLQVLGRMEYAQVLAGVEPFGEARNADAQIGSVTVGGDWIASSLIAGAVAGNAFFGDGDDARMSGSRVKDEPAVQSRIGSLTVGGQVLGTVGGVVDSFGIVAQVVGGIRIGGTAIPPSPGPGKDLLFLGITGDCTVKEV